MVVAMALAGCTPSATPQSAATQSDLPVVPQSAGTPKGEWWDSLTPEQQVASVLMLHYPGTDPEPIAEFVKQFQPAGLIMMGDNVPDDESTIPDLIAQWGDSAGLPLMVAIDEEGGVVTRLPSDTYPSARDLIDGPAKDTEAAFKSRATLLNGLGINVNFGIVADVTDDRNSFIYQRVLGSTPEFGATAVEAAVRGEKGLVASTIKHFPGHGLTDADSHTSIPTGDVDLDTWRQTAALPFHAGIEGGAEMVMMGHLALTSVDREPASLSPAWHQILREDMGFSGIIVTDDMKMLVDSGVAEYGDPVRNAVTSLNAGSTLILTIDGADGEAATEAASQLISGLVEAVDSGDLDPGTVREAAEQLKEFREGLVK